MKFKMLCITPVAHIGDLKERMNELFDFTYLPDPIEDEVKAHKDVEIIFTNPNKSKVYLGKEVIECLPKLKVIATASTGTIHIDKNYCKTRNIKVISITKEISVLERITSTAEHAFLLTLAACRNMVQSCNSVALGDWNYESFVGRQINQLKIGVLGFGRLGKMYAKYAHCFGAEVFVSDPFKTKEIQNTTYKIADEFEIFKNCDVVALHIHATEENIKFVNKRLLSIAKPTLILINTSRGEIVSEDDLLSFLEKNKEAKYFTDVINEEYRGIRNNRLFNSFLFQKQIVITPHIGGMSIDAQLIAYNHCFDMLNKFLKELE